LWSFQESKLRINSISKDIRKDEEDNSDSVYTGSDEFSGFIIKWSTTNENILQAGSCIEYFAHLSKLSKINTF